MDTTPMTPIRPMTGPEWELWQTLSCSAPVAMDLLNARGRKAAEKLVERGHADIQTRDAGTRWVLGRTAENVRVGLVKLQPMD